MRPWRPHFHASPAARKGPILSKRVSSQDPLLRKFGNFSLYSLNFHPNFSSQAPKFGNFQLTSPQIWKFSAHNVSSQAPHFGNPGRTPLSEKKVECPPPPGEAETPTHDHLSFIWTFQRQQYDVFVGYWAQKRWRHNFFLNFSVLDTMYWWSMMENIHSPNWMGIGSWGPEIWPHEYLISPIEISVNWPGSKQLWTRPIYTDFNGAN